MSSLMLFYFIFPFFFAFTHMILHMYAYLYYLIIIIIIDLLERHIDTVQHVIKQCDVSERVRALKKEGG